MLENIKSSFFKKFIFFHLDEERKLQLIKYNKTLQNILDISLINYIIFSGEYIVFEEKGKGKEYDYLDDELIFEGEYLNGKRNGKGKEFAGKDKLIFEGEYLNGKRNGKGKLYDYNDKLIFEGEYLNGKKWNGKRYFKNEIYELKNGKGIMREYDGHLIFEGEYLNGEKNGKGKLYGEKGNLEFEGEYLNGKLWNGKIFFNKKIYEIKNGNLSVKEFDNNGSLIYSFGYFNGEKNGKWMIKEKDNIIFEKKYVNGKLNGKGKEYNFNGKIMFEGEYLYNYKRKGREYVNERLEYEGEYLYGIKWNGKGYDENGNVVYELNNGKGSNREYKYNGQLIFEGEYLYGKRNGKGKEYNDNGDLIFEGEYLNGKRWNGKL